VIISKILYLKSQTLASQKTQNLRFNKFFAIANIKEQTKTVTLRFAKNLC